MAIPYGRDYPEAPWIDRDGQPLDDAAHPGSPGSTGFPGSNGDPILNRMRAWLARFISVMHPRDHDLLVLWIAHTYFVNQTYTTPRLLIDSPVPESGKTTVIEHLSRLCVAPLQMSTVSSPAMITRTLEKGVRTLLIDEADRSLNPDKPGIDDLIAVLNSGYKRGATRPVLVPVKGGGWEVDEMPTFAPVAMAGNQPKLPDDTMSRIIRVLLMPDHDGTVEDSDWEVIEAEAENIAQALKSWADQTWEQVRDMARPSLPAGANARVKERWLPLKRVAVVAGGRWPQVVDNLVDLDLQRMALEREEGIHREPAHVTLVKNISDVWPEGETFFTTDGLLAALKGKFGDAWGPSEKYRHGLTAQRLGRMLVRNYGVYSDRIDVANKGPRGYYASAFDSALRSLRLPPLNEPGKPVEPGEPG